MEKGEPEGDSSALRRRFASPFAFGLLALLALPLCAQQPISWTTASRGAGADERYVGEPISMSLRDADLVETLRTFARIGGFNLLVQPGVKGSVTVELRGVPWDQALEAILKIHGLGMEVTTGTLRVADNPTLEREARNRRYYGPLSGRFDGSPMLRTRRIEGQLRHVDARRMAELLHEGSYLSPDGEATALQDNVLRLEERVGRVQRVVQFVERLDEADVAKLDGDALERRAAEIWRQLGADGQGPS